MRRLLPPALILAVLLGCAAGAAQARHADTTLDLVAYSTPKPVMAKLITRFEHQPAGQGVSFSQSYGPSGAQAKAIAAGQPADIAFLSTGIDIALVLLIFGVFGLLLWTAWQITSRTVRGVARLRKRPRRWPR